MTPLELFEAIGKMDPDSIQDSIQLYLADTLASEAEQDNKEVHKNPMPAKAAGIREQSPAERRYGIALLPYLLTAGCTAACIAGFGLMIRFSMGNEIVGTQSEIPISVQESVSSVTTAVSTGERAVLTAITETHSVQQTVTVTAEDRTEPVSVTETDAVTGTAAITETAAAVTAMQTETAGAETQTEPLPLTETTAAETQTETTAAEPPPLVYEMGDADMNAIIDYHDKMIEYGFSDEMITALRDSEPVRPIKFFAYVNMKKGFNVANLLPSGGGTMHTSVNYNYSSVSYNGYVSGPSSALCSADYDASTGIFHTSFGTGGYSNLMNTLNTNLFRGKYTYSGATLSYTDMISVPRPDVTNPSMLSDSQIDSCFEYGVIGAGDVNGDGLISSADAKWILRYDIRHNTTGHIPAGTTSLMLAAGDVNCDGAVDIADAKAVVNHLANPTNSSYYFW